MATLRFFTWNLCKSQIAHDLSVDHLALLGRTDPFVACFQELPGGSAIANARLAASPDLTARRIAVVRLDRRIPGLALAHDPSLRVVGPPVLDEDDEFLAAVFERASDGKKIAVIGVHGKSKVDMHRPEDHGGSRALLRHAIHGLGLTYDHLVAIGDFNSPMGSREMQSWHGFYALSGNKPVGAANAVRRRGLPHPPLYVVRPSNEQMGTMAVCDSGGIEPAVVDFAAVDATARVDASSRILTEVAASPIWDFVNDRPDPNVSDHAPVEATIDI